MRNLIAFLARYNHWLLFIILELVSFWLLFRFNSYQGSVFFTSANRVVGSIYGLASSVNDYLGLRTANEALFDRNLELVIENERLRSVIDSLGMESSVVPSDTSFVTIGAKVVNNSVNRLDNYITIDKGRADGVEADMGIVSPVGVVGIVCMVSAHHALAISVLNSNSSVSCKLERSGYFGNLKWNGGDSRTAQLTDIPRHAEVNVGDTVVTSGYSSVFPEGLMVGIVSSHGFSPDGLTCAIGVRLSSDMAKLNMVRVIRNKHAAEHVMLSDSLKRHRQ